MCVACGLLDRGNNKQPPVDRINADIDAIQPESVAITTQIIPSPVERAVSLRWLVDFAAQNRGKRFSFERREFLAPADGGGTDACINISADALDAH
eukprot:SAG11_NODE_14330_length_616_cov_1.191489_2_plen_95_part_01